MIDQSLQTSKKNGPWIRVCPSCLKEVRYKSFNSLQQSIKKDKSCKKCTIDKNLSLPKKGTNHPSYKDITNQKFGCYIAIRFVENKNGRSLWLFKCDCGKEIIRDRRSVENKSDNCPHISHYDRDISKFIGKTFDRWTILGEVLPRYRDSEIQVLVRCNCKNKIERIHYLNYIIKGYSRSCGCLSVENSKIFFRKQKISQFLRYFKNKIRILKNDYLDEFGKINYNKYLESRDWFEKRLSFISKCNFTCEGCGYNSDPLKLQLHHKTYENLGREADADLRVLCRKCHTSCHFGKNPIL